MIAGSQTRELHLAFITPAIFKTDFRHSLSTFKDFQKILDFCLALKTSL